jgi:hypothetical protein
VVTVVGAVRIDDLDLILRRIAAVTLCSPTAARVRTDFVDVDIDLRPDGRAATVPGLLSDLHE